MELLIYFLVAAALAAIAMSVYRPTDLTARYQAEQMRNDIRHMQMLAMTWGVTLRLTATGSSYSVTCDTSTVAPCPGSTATSVTDPATAAAFSVNLGSGLTLTGPTATPVLDHLRVDALGRPRNASTLLSTDTTYAVSASGSPTSTITVKPITAFPTVTP